MKNDIIKQSFSINLAIMGALHLYPPDNRGYVYIIRAYIMYFFCIILLPFLILFYFLLEEEFDIMTMNFNAGFIVETMCFIIKLLPFMRHGHKIKICIHFFEDPYFTTRKEKHTKIIEDCIKICKRNSMAFLIGVTVGVICWVIRPFFRQGYTLPLDVWLPFSVEADLKMYYSVYLFLAIAIPYTAFSGSMIDPLIGGLAYHGAGQIKILKDNLQHLTNYVEEEISRNTTFLSLNSLLSISNSLTDAIYMGNWYDYDPKSKKALILLMENSKRPIIITAGKLVELSLTTFTL
ncbi:7tm 6 domain containing protein, partial [Asbolus verrucosus]